MFDKEEYKSLVEKCIHHTEIFKGVLLDVKKDDVSLPNGEISSREYIVHIGAVCIVPVDNDGNVILERQFRYPVNSVLTEIPAGKLNYKEEDPLLAAKRELEEETGFTADEWTDLGIFYPAAAYSGEKITMFLARSLHKGERHLDEDEFLSIFSVPLEKAYKMALDGELSDLKTQNGIMRAYGILNQNN